MNTIEDVTSNYFRYSNKIKIQFSWKKYIKRHRNSENKNCMDSPKKYQKTSDNVKVFYRGVGSIVTNLKK